MSSPSSVDLSSAVSEPSEEVDPPNPRALGSVPDGAVPVVEAAVPAIPDVPDAVVRIWPARVVVALGAVLPAVLMAVLQGRGPIALTFLGLWVVMALTRSAGVRRVVPLGEQLASDVRVTVVFGSLICLAAVAGLLPIGAARGSLVLVFVAAVSTFLVRALQPRRLVTRRIVLVGSRQEVEAYASSGLDEVVVGCHVVDASPGLSLQTLPFPATTTLEMLGELVNKVDADAILVLPGVDVTADVVRHLTWMFEDSDVTVGVVCPVSSVSAHRMHTTVSGTSTVLELAVPRATTAARVAKAFLDRVGAAILLLVTAPLMVVLWAAVRLDTRGSGFFVQTRIGQGGRPFRMVKLRTMRPDAESLVDALAEENESDGVLFKIRRDPRVTRIGYWLRRSSLDELPQLFNVLQGNMSLVGPRPALPEEVAEYDDVARRRLVVKPGITGLWQVSGRSDLLWDESLRLDLYYADNWRIIDDFTIAARTITAVTQARGAY